MSFDVRKGRKQFIKFNNMKTTYQFLFSIIGAGMMCLLGYGQAQAQNPATYGYDASGNRINRVITLVSHSPAQPQSEEEPAEQKVFSETLNDFSVRIYPNPTKGAFTVEIPPMPKGKTASLRLFSASGKLIHHKNGFHGGIERFNIGHHPSGLYLLKIVAGDSSTEWKIIKQ